MMRREIAKEYVDKQLAVLKKYGSLKGELPKREYNKLIATIEHLIPEPPSDRPTQTMCSADIGKFPPLRFICRHGDFAEPCKDCKGTVTNCGSTPSLPSKGKEEVMNECPQCHSSDPKQLNEACQSRSWGDPVHFSRRHSWHAEQPLSISLPVQARESYVECSCDPMYSHHCMICGGTGRKKIRVASGSTPSPDPPQKSDYCDTCGEPVTGSVHYELPSRHKRCCKCWNRMSEPVKIEGPCEARAALAPSLPAQDAQFILDLLRFAAEHDQADRIMFHIGDDEQLHAAANCSDAFYWACADAEDITPENLDLYKSTVEECDKLVCEKGHASVFADELFCARVRKMQPQGASYHLYPHEMWPLFNACGPERNADKTCFGNPKNRPATKEEAKGWNQPRRPKYEELEAEIERLRGSAPSPDPPPPVQREEWDETVEEWMNHALKEMCLVARSGCKHTEYMTHTDGLRQPLILAMGRCLGYGLAEIERLREALRRYGCHERSCSALRVRVKIECNCGFDAALAPSLPTKEK